MRHKPPKIIEFSKELRRLGHSISEIQHKIQERFGQSPSYETIRIYVKNTLITAKIQNDNTKEAAQAAKKIITDLKNRDFYLIASLLFWPRQGTTDDFVITTSDERLLYILIESTRHAVHTSNDRFEFTIRLTPHHDKHACLRFWTKALSLPASQFKGYYVQKSKKSGTQFGVCRLRLTRGARMLALTSAIVNRVIEILKIMK